MEHRFLGTTDGKRWVSVPYDCEPTTTGGIQGVYLSPHEEVEWMFAYNPSGGRHVIGYTIKMKLPEVTTFQNAKYD